MILRKFRGDSVIHSFLLIGQSNMAGRGYLNEAADIDTSRIRILRNGRWQQMFRPINPDRSFSGVSLAESFAESYAKEYNADVGLICCADGGTKLEQWKPGSLLFDNAVLNGKLAARTSVIAGVLWHQGEGDCSGDLYPTYKERFEVMMAAFRKELNLYDVPFLLGGLGDFLPERAKIVGGNTNNYLNYGKLNDQLRAIAESNPMTGFVSAEGLTSNPDYLHFNAESLYEFGLRYFAAYNTLRDKNKNFDETALEDDSKRSALELL